jgi:hypothetical protein
MEEASAPAGAGRLAVASYGSYREAERAVDFLSDQGFPVERAAIVGTGLRTVEQIAGRLTTGRAALMGAGQGAMIGLLFALFLGLFFTIDEDFLGLLLYALIVGALFGAAFAALFQALQRGRRDFASVRGMEAEHYELQVDQEVSARATQLLGEMPAA